MRCVRVYKQERRERTPEQLKETPRLYYYERTFDYVGTFAGYGLDIEEYENSIASYTCAIVEKDDGTVDLVPVRLIEFVQENSDV